MFQIFFISKKEQGKPLQVEAVDLEDVISFLINIKQSRNWEYITKSIENSSKTQDNNLNLA